MSQNEQFHQACEQWIQAALRLLVNKQMPYEEDIEVTFTPNGYQRVPSTVLKTLFRLTMLFSITEYLATLPKTLIELTRQAVKYC